MSWKFVLNGNAYKNHLEASSAAGESGYSFFLYHNVVYFRDKTFLRVYDTGLTEEDLF